MTAPAKTEIQFGTPPERESLRKLAESIAKEAARMIDSSGYDAAKTLLSFHRVAEPKSFQNQERGKVLRITNSDWWLKRLSVRNIRELEKRQRETGLVTKYVSQAGLNNFIERQKSSLEGLKTLQAVNQTTGDCIDLVDIIESSTANPKNRHNELMASVRGTEEYAKSKDHVAMFYTITCPSKYHAYSWDKKTKRSVRNSKFGKNGSPLYTPRDGQKYLVNVWAKIRAKLKRDGLNVYGLRVAEPHHDGTPHWHLLLFMSRNITASVTSVMRNYAMQEDQNEAGAKKHRFTVKRIDPKKGSAAGYVAKYISKNIMGMGVDEDYELGIDAATGAELARAWASTWGVRQFQRIGGAPVTVWRELRKQRDTPKTFFKLQNEAKPVAGMSVSEFSQKTRLQRAADKARATGDWDEFDLFLKRVSAGEDTTAKITAINADMTEVLYSQKSQIEKARCAADSGDWQAYLSIQGGADIDRKDQLIKLHATEFREDGEEIVNRYDEPVRKIKGVQESEKSVEGDLFPKFVLITRLDEWTIEKKPTDEASGEIEPILSDGGFSHVSAELAAGVSALGLVEITVRDESTDERMILNEPDYLPFDGDDIGDWLTFAEMEVRQ